MPEDDAVLGSRGPGLNQDRILDHANERLAAPETLAGRAGQIEAFKRFLKLETERLRIRHRLGMGGGDIAEGRSYIVDLVICKVCQLAAGELAPAESSEVGHVAVVALGGYGRKELAPYSDIDLLFLHPGRPSKTVKQFVEQVLYLLWDMGLTVGHSFRSIGESVSMAREDLHTRTAMAEARLLTGNEALFKQLSRELDGAIYSNKKETEAFFAAMRTELEGRYDKFGRAVCLQEPNVKESAGGLRDLHTVLWAGRARYACKRLEDLRAKDLITGTEYQLARRAYDFLYRARNEAHFATGRKTDLLSLDVQPTIATNLGYKPKKGLAPSEVFMRDYYRQANELHGFCESFLIRVGGMQKPKWRFRFREKVERRGIFEIREGTLQTKGDPADFHPTAARLLEIFTLAQTEGAGISDELKLAVRGNLRLIDRRFRGAKEASKALLGILGRPGQVAGSLRAMHATGLLGRLLPEFARITFLVQHDFYHRYTVDEHTLTAIDALDEVASTPEPSLARFKKVLHDLPEPSTLYLGMLLHDIGKGLGGGHVGKGVKIAERICRRLGLGEEAAADVIFLVQNHLVMSHLSQRRDIAEPALVDSFVGVVGTLNRLDMLMLLTYADHRGVGPGVWNEWKGSLLFDLYEQAKQQLSGRGRRSEDRRETHFNLVEQLAGEFKRSELERHLALLPERYLRTTDVPAVANHLRLIARLGQNRLVADWRMGADRNCTELTICARDRTGLFAAMAGTLTGHGLNILSVDVYTREDGYVLDTFKISDSINGEPVGSDRWPTIEASLGGAVDGHYDVLDAVENWRARAPRRPGKRGAAHKPVKPAVRFDTTSSAERTVVEVRAEDELGLLYKIASTLASLGLDIHFAKIATEKSHALDVFYVTDEGGRKLDAERMKEVEARLLDALGTAREKAVKGGVS
jgi:[protein-PII] uridylyltransferase